MRISVENNKSFDVENHKLRSECNRKSRNATRIYPGQYIVHVQMKPDKRNLNIKFDSCSITTICSSKWVVRLLSYEKFWDNSKKTKLCPFWGKFHKTFSFYLHHSRFYSFISFSRNFFCFCQTSNQWSKYTMHPFIAWRIHSRLARKLTKILCVLMLKCWFQSFNNVNLILCSFWKISFHFLRILFRHPIFPSLPCYEFNLIS